MVTCVAMYFFIFLIAMVFVRHRLSRQSYTEHRAANMLYQLQVLVTLLRHTCNIFPNMCTNASICAHAHARTHARAHACTHARAQSSKLPLLYQLQVL